jgi:hypothetical protein
MNQKPMSEVNLLDPEQSQVEAAVIVVVTKGQTHMHLRLPVQTKSLQRMASPAVAKPKDHIT